MHCLIRSCVAVPYVSHNQASCYALTARIHSGSQGQFCHVKYLFKRKMTINSSWIDMIYSVALLWDDPVESIRLERLTGKHIMDTYRKEIATDRLYIFVLVEWFWTMFWQGEMCLLLYCDHWPMCLKKVYVNLLLVFVFFFLLKGHFIHQSLSISEWVTQHRNVL